MNEYGSASARSIERVTDGMTVVDAAGEKVGKVDGPGFTDTDRYVRADVIRAVSDDTVILSVRKDQLPKED